MTDSIILALLVFALWLCMFNTVRLAFRVVRAVRESQNYLDNALGKEKDNEDATADASHSRPAFVRRSTSDNGNR